MKLNELYNKIISQRKTILIIGLIVFAGLILRMYKLDVLNPFGYDQVDNAWAAKNIIVNHWFPLVGMVAKANSGIFIGPLYYYFVAFFYWLYNLNPAAIIAISLVSSVFTFFTILYTFKNIFNYKVAIIALFINTFNVHAVIFDKVQWPVQLFPAVSLIIFYFLYEVIKGDSKKILPLGFFVGLSFHLHFTAIFFPLIILLALPMFPRNKKTLLFSLASLAIVIIFLAPNIFYEFTSKDYGNTISNYFYSNFHGFHLRRLLQILNDALVQLNFYLFYDRLMVLKIVVLPIFGITLLLDGLFKSSSKKIIYLTFLWFIIPWTVLSTYKGEISDYYFSINRFLALFIFSYLIYIVLRIPHFTAKLFILIFFSFYCLGNVTSLIKYNDVGLAERISKVEKSIREGKEIGYQVGVPESYIYYYLMRKKGVTMYD